MASLALGCGAEAPAAGDPAVGRPPALKAAQVLAVAEQIASREPGLSARLAQRGWSAREAGLTSTAWAATAGPGRARIASRLPARADGAWETHVAGASALKLALRVDGSRSSAAELVDGRVVYRDTFARTHTVFSADAHEAELNFMLHDARAPHEFVLEIDLRGSELTPRRDPGQQIAFIDRQGRTRLLIGTPYAVDADGVRRVAQLSLEGERVRLRFDPAGMRYPILLDPPLGVPSWTQQFPATSPAARSHYGLAALGDTLVMFGGMIDDTPTDETWEWDGIDWSLRDPVTRPSARAPWRQMATYGSAIVLFSGSGSNAADTWSWDGNEWTELTPEDAPPYRAGGQLIAAGGDLLLFGGENASGVVQTDAYRWNGSNWSVDASAGTPPAVTFGASAPYGADSLAFGGIDASKVTVASTFQYGAQGWSPLAPATSPPARSAAAMAALPSSVVLFGGFDGLMPLADTWEWDGETWIERTTMKAPAARHGSQLAPYGGAAVMFGGFDGKALLADTWVYATTPLSDDGTACTAAEQCGSGFCVDGYCCDTACGDGVDDCQACNLQGSAGTCTLAGSDTVCRAATDLCDAAESCTGDSATCPQDGLRGAGDVCRAAAGDCDAAETCDGNSAVCPEDLKSNSATTCRPSADVCDLSETCTGSGDDCPPDVVRAAGESCADDGNPCTLDVCDGASTACTHPAGNADALCRSAAGPCDAAESCDGISEDCPADALAAQGTACRGAAGECDLPAVCDGSSADCPANPYRPQGTPCTDDGNVCTEDVCSGSSDSCTHPPGSPGALCRAANGDCDVAEQCTGSSALCPADTYLDSTTTCRAASCSGGVQVLAAVCSGDGPSCPTAASSPCAGFACDVAACFASCESEAQCAAAHFCALDGTCEPKRGNGAACTSADQCTSGSCVDGYCCNDACAGQCEACDVDSLLGTCSPVTGEPHGARPACDSDGSVCAGSCDGQSRTSCAYPDGSQVCRDASCTDGVATLEASCDGDGACGALMQIPCTPFTCGDVTCSGDCAIDMDCANDAFCFGGVCQPRLENGDACTADNQCLSAVCADGVCCGSACDGQCEACDIPDFEGMCRGVVGAPRGARPACAGDSSSCAGSCDGATRDACVFPGGDQNCRLGSCSGGIATVAAFCDGTGFCPALETRSCEPYVCGATGCLGDCAEDSDCLEGSFCLADVCTPKRDLGEACGGDNACSSGFCVDGRCCDEACGGQCEACDLAGVLGTCSPVLGAPHGGRTPCDSDGSACGGQCGGVDRDGCVYPGGETRCRDASCSDGTATVAASCLGTGECPGVQQQSCAPYACGETQCAGECADSLGCQGDNYCSAGVCVPRRARGQPCGADDQCTSGVCVDGYCCDTTCDGLCEACDVEGLEGTCSPVTGAPRGGRDACAGVGTCAGSCDGVETRSCTYPGTDVTCTTATCEGGMTMRASSCDGAGTCRTPERRSCSPYVCGENDCSSTCTSDAQCVSGHVCVDAECVLPADGGTPDAGTAGPDASVMLPDAGALDAGAPDDPFDPDLDSDGDGIPDELELGPEGESIDSDGDGVPNHLDDDDDGDSIPTRLERGRGKTHDLDGDGVPNHLDRDADGDGIDDEDEVSGDTDGDGVPDYKDPAKLEVSGSSFCAVEHPGAAQRVPTWLLVLGLLGLWLRRRARAERSAAPSRAKATRSRRGRA